MAGIKFTNNAVGQLSAGITAVATTITLAGGQGARFPTLGAGDYFYGTLIRASDSSREIVKVTARATDSLTVTRAQESTTGLVCLAGDKFELRITAAGLAAIAFDPTAVAITGGTIAGVAISGGTVAGSAISGGTVAGAAITGGTVSGLATPLAVADGGTGATTAAGAATALGIGLIKISSGSVAAATASQWVTLSGGYAHYRLILSNFVPATAGQDLGATLSTNSRVSSLAAGSYGFQGRLIDAVPGVDKVSTAVNAISLLSNQINTSSFGSVVTVDMHQSSAGSRFRLTTTAQYLDNGSSEAFWTGGGYAAGNTAITDILLAYIAGNIGVAAQSATWTLYGYN